MFGGGAIAAHENGNIIKVNGSYMHSLGSNCELLREKLPINRAHNGLLILSDGTIITKDCRLEGQGNFSITRLDPDTLELIHEPFELPRGLWQNCFRVQWIKVSLFMFQGSREY